MTKFATRLRAAGMTLAVGAGALAIAAPAHAQGGSGALQRSGGCSAGATWKLNQSGRSVVKAYYGRLYRGLFTQDFQPANPSITPRYIFDVTPSGQRHRFTARSRR